MAVDNQFLNAVDYANTMLLLVKNELVMGRLVSKQFLPDVSDENGLKIFVKRPPRFIQTTGATFQPQNIATGRTEIEVTQYKNVHLNITDLQYVQSMNQLMLSETMKSAASTLAQGVDTYLQGFLQRFPSWVNSPGATGTDYALATPQQFIPVATRLGNLAVPGSDRHAVFSLEDSAGIQGSLIDKYMSGVAQTALEKGRIPMLSNIKGYETQNTQIMSTGTRTTSGAAQVDGATENVNYRSVKDTARFEQTLSLKGLTNGNTINAGEVFTIAGVYAVNPRQTSPDGTGIRTLTYLQQFTVLDTVTVTGTTEDIQISPPIIVPFTDATGAVTEVKWENTAFATASAIPSDSANVVWVGNASSSFTQRAAFHKTSLQMVGARLITPFNGISAFATDPESGLSIRYWRGSDFTNATHGHRWDMIYGAQCVQPMLGTRFSGTA